ncbi:MAG TPA: hypothetical protein VKV17_06585 [Bryobacteraceae bacterium]|nr:hypothetical protein [Bryobacteraceae bacterium]
MWFEIAEAGEVSPLGGLRFENDLVGEHLVVSGSLKILRPMTSPPAPVWNEMVEASGRASDNGGDIRTDAHLEPGDLDFGQLTRPSLSARDKPAAESEKGSNDNLYPCRLEPAAASIRHVRPIRIDLN